MSLEADDLAQSLRIRKLTARTHIDIIICFVCMSAVSSVQLSLHSLVAWASGQSTRFPKLSRNNSVYPCTFMRFSPFRTTQMCKNNAHTTGGAYDPTAARHVRNKIKEMIAVKTQNWDLL